MPRIARILAAFALLGAGAAGAEHEVYYRYVVLGYVTDAGGRPARARAVELVRDKTGFSYLGETDEQGLFILVARIADESVGEALTLHVGAVTARLTARFDPANHQDDRGTRVDLEGGKLVERAAWFRPTLAHVLGGPPR